jgi:predicted MPP superfamily phosphohydrolase
VEEEIPVVAVLGNHDYSLAKEDDEINEAMADYLRSSLEDFGIIVLENDSYSLTNDSGSTFHVIGLGSKWAGQSDILKPFNIVSANEPRVVVMHNPVVYRDIPADQGTFTLAAHTHGGQIHLPLMPDSKHWLDIALPREVVAEGWADDSIGRGNNRLYVNRGIGFSLLPIRFFCRPELTIFNLSQKHGTLTQSDSE